MRKSEITHATSAEPVPRKRSALEVLSAGPAREAHSPLSASPGRPLSPACPDLRVGERGGRRSRGVSVLLLALALPLSAQVTDGTVKSHQKISDTTATLAGLSNGTTYYYRITAMDSSGNDSDYSNEVNEVPVGLAGAWATKAAMPTARGLSLGVGVVNGILYAVGGNDGATVLNAVEAYDPLAGTWATKAAMPTARDRLAVGVVNGILYAVGGYSGSGSSGFATVEAYDPGTDT